MKVRYRYCKSYDDNSSAQGHLASRLQGHDLNSVYLTLTHKPLLCYATLPGALEIGHGVDFSFDKTQWLLLPSLPRTPRRKPNWANVPQAPERWVRNFFCNLLHAAPSSAPPGLTCTFHLFCWAMSSHLLSCRCSYDKRPSYHIILPS